MSLKLFPVFAIVFLLSACDKTDEHPITPVAPAGKEVKPCDGMNFCYIKDDVARGFNAKWRRIPASNSSPEKIHVFYEENQGVFQMEIDVYSVGPGFFGITAEHPGAGDATFTYFDGPLRLKAAAGMVEITDINEDDNTLTGSFYATAEKNDTLYKFTEGNMVNVPMK